MRSSGPRIFFFRRFLITDSISLLIIGLFRFSNIFMFCVSICPFLPRLSSFFFWYRIVHSILTILFISVKLIVCMCYSLQLCLTLWHHGLYSPPGSFVHGILQVRILEWISYSLLQGIFPSQESNADLLHYRWMLYHLSHQRSSQIDCSARIFISYFSIFILSLFS